MMSNCTIKHFLVIASLALNIATGQFPDYIHKCSKSNEKLNECISQNGNIALPILLKGVPSLNIAVMVPFQLPEMDLKITDNLHYHLSDGISSIDPDAVKMSYADINFTEKTLEMDFKSQDLIWNVGFVATGNILGKPVKEQGRMNLTFNDLQFNYTGHFDSKNIDGKDCMQFTSGSATTHSKSFDMKYYEQESVDDKITDEQQEEFVKVSQRIVLAIREQVKSIGDTLMTLALNSILKMVPEDEVFDP